MGLCCFYFPAKCLCAKWFYNKDLLFSVLTGWGQGREQGLPIRAVVWDCGVVFTADLFCDLVALLNPPVHQFFPCVKLG